MPRTKIHRTADEISMHLHLPLAEAAKNMGMCTALLKRVCREHGITRWPHRQIRSISGQLDITAPGSPFNPRLEQDLEALKQWRETTLKHVKTTSIDSLLYDKKPIRDPEPRNVPLTQSSPIVQPPPTSIFPPSLFPHTAILNKPQSALLTPPRPATPIQLAPLASVPPGANNILEPIGTSSLDVGYLIQRFRQFEPPQISQSE